VDYDIRFGFSQRHYSTLSLSLSLSPPFFTLFFLFSVLSTPPCSLFSFRALPASSLCRDSFWLAPQPNLLVPFSMSCSGNFFLQRFLLARTANRLNPTLSHILLYLRTKFLLAGDLNVKFPLWKIQVSNSSGEKLLKLFDNNDFQLLAPQSPTH